MLYLSQSAAIKGIRTIHGRFAARIICQNTGGRWVVLFLIVAALVVAAAYGVAYFRRAPDAVPPLAKADDDTTLCRRRRTEHSVSRYHDRGGDRFRPRGGATGEKMLPESGGSGCAFSITTTTVTPTSCSSAAGPGPGTSKSRRRPFNALALYRNDGEKFANVTAESGLAADIYGQGVAVGDYDADGDDDLFFTAVGTNRMFRNDAGKFVDVTAETGLAGSADDWTTSTGFFDYDRDGDLDLFVCNYLRWTREIDKAATKRVPGEGLTYAHPANFDGVQNYLYRNDGGKFTDVAAAAGIHVTDPETGKPVGKALAVTFVDFDQDGWLDIFVANDTVRHFLFRNRGDGTFEEVGESRGFALNAAGLTTSGMGIDAAWIHNDDQLAVAMSNFANEMTSLYVLQGKDDLFFTDETIPPASAGRRATCSRSGCCSTTSTWTAASIWWKRTAIWRKRSRSRSRASSIGSRQNFSGTPGPTSSRNLSTCRLRISPTWRSRSLGGHWRRPISTATATWTS